MHGTITTHMPSHFTGGQANTAFNGKMKLYKTEQDRPQGAPCVCPGIPHHLPGPSSVGVQEARVSGQSCGAPGQLARGAKGIAPGSQFPLTDGSHVPVQVGDLVPRP